MRSLTLELDILLSPYFNWKLLDDIKKQFIMNQDIWLTEIPHKS